MAKRRRRKNRTEKRAPKRISAALSRFLKKMNPAKMRGVKMVRVKKLKGGGVTITPVRKKSARRRNESISEGYYNETGFHPIRSADDYDPEAVGESRAYAARKRRKARR